MPLEKQSPDPRSRAGSRANLKPRTSTYSVDAHGKQIDFDATNRAALAALPAILSRLLPGGKIISGEYVALNPTRADRRRGSFKINLRSGRWADFATGDRGGDLVALVAYLDNVRQFEAAIRLGRMLGINPGD